MNSQSTTINPTDQVITLALSSWQSRNKAVSDFFNKYNHEVYLNEVSPGRNRGIYLLGHLIAANDGMIPLFGLGKRLYPDLEELFSKNPDKTFTDLPSIAELKKRWDRVNKELSGLFNALTSEEWLDRHTSVSEEDFVKEPHRNKLNALLGRTNHMSYHLGQLNFLTEN